MTEIEIKKKSQEFSCIICRMMEPVAGLMHYGVCQSREGRGIANAAGSVITMYWRINL